MKAENDLLSNYHSAGLRLLCSTWWTVCADSLLSIINNYSTLLSTWNEALEATKITEAKARIQGVEAPMKTFNILFGTTDNLGKTLQNKATSAAEGQEVANMVVHTLECYEMIVNMY